METTPPSPIIPCLGPYTFENLKQIVSKLYISFHFLQYPSPTYLLIP